MPEAAGLEAILTGMQAFCSDDDQLLTAMLPVLDACYAALRQASA